MVMLHSYLSGIITSQRTAATWKLHGNLMRPLPPRRLSTPSIKKQRRSRMENNLGLISASIATQKAPLARIVDGLSLDDIFSSSFTMTCLPGYVISSLWKNFYLPGLATANGDQWAESLLEALREEGPQETCYWRYCSSPRQLCEKL